MVSFPDAGRERLPIDKARLWGGNSQQKLIKATARCGAVNVIIDTTQHGTDPPPFVCN